jgi:predicted ester cyclase
MSDTDVSEAAKAVVRRNSEEVKVLRGAFPDFHADPLAGLRRDLVTTYETYYGTHKGEFFGIAPTGRSYGT